MYDPKDLRYHPSDMTIRHTQDPHASIVASFNPREVPWQEAESLARLWLGASTLLDAAREVISEVRLTSKAEKSLNSMTLGQEFKDLVEAVGACEPDPEPVDTIAVLRRFNEFMKSQNCDMSAMHPEMRAIWLQTEAAIKYDNFKASRQGRR